MKKVFLFLFLLIIFNFACSDEASSVEEYNCYSRCEYWEYCNLDNNKCEVNKADDFCTEDYHCGENYICNNTKHRCEIQSSTCSDGCSLWETCIDDFCELKNGYCYLNHDCKIENEYCDIDIHICLELDSSCDLDCQSWENCVISDDNKESCIVKNTFNWSKIDIKGEYEDSYIYSPFKVNNYGYNPSNETVLNYYSRTEELSTIGKLNLKDGVQTESFLTISSAPGVNSFCDSNIEQCQFISYNKFEDKFMVLGLNSRALLYIGDYNTVTKQNVDGEYPKSGLSTVSSFNNNGDTLFLYENSLSEINTGQVYMFSSYDMKWKLVVKDLPNLSNNCLVSDDNYLYSFGGVLGFNEDEKEYSSKYYKIDYEIGEFEALDIPIDLKERTNFSCAYDSERELIFIYGGAKVINDLNETVNYYHNDLWSFSPADNKWNLILENVETGSYLPISENLWAYDTDIDKPNFGKNTGKMIYDEKMDRLIIMGDVPYNKGIQVYTINLK